MIKESDSMMFQTSDVQRITITFNPEFKLASQSGKKETIKHAATLEERQMISLNDSDSES